MSFDGSICFFILFHYKSNAILTTPIAGLDDVSIFNAYKRYFKDLTAKGFKPKLNVIDNQVTKHIKKFLTRNVCKLQVVEPHNHRVNAAKRAIQTFKAAFIAAPTTIDRDFPSNCGLDLSRRSRSPSTCCGLCKMTHQNQRTRSSMACTIRTVISLPHLGARQLSTRTGTHAAYGRPKAWMLSTWVQQRIITDASIITFPKHKPTGYRAQWSYFHNIASCPP